MRTNSIVFSVGHRRRSNFLAAVACGGATCLAASGGLAAAEDTDTSQLQEVIVTGSRIATPELQSVAPIAVVTSASIESTGTINIADSLRDLPSVGSSGLASNNSNFLTSDSGINTINLRNLGDVRTLVLVNGRRMTPGVSGTTEVDLNTIPTEFIDRIEIVTGGASAIYGSDAVAGAVNIITKKNFDGLQFMGQTGRSGSADDGNYILGMLFGSSFADSRGQFMFNVSHDKEDGLRSSARKLSATDMFVNAGPPPPLGNGGLVNPQYSSYTPQGNFFVNSAQGGFGDAFSFANDGSLIDGNLGPGFNRSAQRLLIVPVERTLVASTASYDLTDHHHAYAELTYSDTTSRSQIEPLPLASNNVNGIYETATDANGDSIGMPITNAYLQTLPQLAPILSEINAWNNTGANCTGSLATNPAYDCIKYINFRRRLSDIADRTNSNTRQMNRIVLGVNGDLPFGDWKYDTSYVYGRTTDAQITTGSVNLINFQESLNSIVGTGGQIVCADPVAQSQGCVPVNVFGKNSITPAAANWLAATTTRNATISEEVISASVNGSIGELPAGKPELVLGTEFRKDKSSEIWDPLTNEGLNGSNQLPNVEGGISVKEAFVETEVPILKDLPAVKSLDLNGAFREADYNTSGKVNAWKVGLNWAVIPDVRLRAVYSRAVRAPNVGELYGGQSQTFVTVNDPCDGIGTAGYSQSPQIVAACKAIPGIAQAIANTGSFSYAPLDKQNEFGLLGSNPNLKPERSKTKTFGVVLTPSFLPGFAMTVDYFDIIVDGAVNTINQDVLAQNCLLTGESTFCSNIIRNANTGKITEFLALNQNVGYIRSGGVDTAISYRFSLPRSSSLLVNLSETHQLKLEQAVPGAPTEVDLGQLNASGRLGAGFKDRAVLNLDYALADFEATWRVNYLGKIQDANDPSQVIFQPYNNVPAYIYNDAQVRYTFQLSDKSKVTAYLGANNLFNKKPPFLPSGMVSNVTGSSTADSYDEVGLFWYAGFKLKF